MRIHGIRLEVIILVFLITLGLAVGLQHVVYRQRVIEPITESFSSIEGVADVSVWQSSNTIQIMLTLGEVDNFPAMISEIRERAAAVNTNLDISISDSANNRLLDSGWQMAFPIEEALAIGNFQEMARTVEEIAAEQNIAFHIYIDSDYVYLELSEGQSHYYQVFSRGEAPEIRRRMN